LSNFSFGARIELKITFAHKSNYLLSVNRQLRAIAIIRVGRKTNKRALTKLGEKMINLPPYLIRHDNSVETRKTLKINSMGSFM
jgi:hypothetical protein